MQNQIYLITYLNIKRISIETSVIKVRDDWFSIEKVANHELRPRRNSHLQHLKLGEIRQSQSSKDPMLFPSTHIPYVVDNENRRKK